MKFARRVAWGGFAAALLLLPSNARATDASTERFDHRGAVGLLLGGGLGFKDQLVAGVVENGLRFPFDLGGTLSMGHSGNELTAHLLATLGGGSRHDAGASAGYRSYFGEEQFKTYVSLELAVHVAPVVTVGPRVGFGVQYELLPTLGVFLGGVADLGAAQGLRFSAELGAGVHLRTYLFEG